MNSKQRNRAKGGFSLIELVIVVVIIAIIGAIAIPRMSRGAAGAADSALIGDLAVLRNAIELYATEHGGQYPTVADFEEQLTLFSNFEGTVTQDTKDGAAGVIYGPYLRRLPPLPVGSNRGESAVMDATSGSLGAAGFGWVYNENNGTIRANLADTETDEAETPYNEY